MGPGYSQEILKEGLQQLAGRKATETATWRGGQLTDGFLDVIAFLHKTRNDGENITKSLQKD